MNGYKYQMSNLSLLLNTSSATNVAQMFYNSKVVSNITTRSLLIPIDVL